MFMLLYRLCCVYVNVNAHAHSNSSVNNVNFDVMS